MADPSDAVLQKSQGQNNPPQLTDKEGLWRVQDGGAEITPPTYRGTGNFQGDVEHLTYTNPFCQDVERAWFDGKLVYAVDAGEVNMPEAGNVKVAKEYQPVYSVELDEKGKLKSKKEIDGQYNIYDSVPGMEKYNAIWQFYYVIVPQDFTPNALRSEQDCLNSGYQILKSNMFEN